MLPLHVSYSIAYPHPAIHLIPSQVMLQCKMFHEDVRHLSDAFRAEQGRINYVTPTSYLELITCFTMLLGAKRAEVGTKPDAQGRN